MIINVARLLARSPLNERALLSALACSATSSTRGYKRVVWASSATSRAAAQRARSRCCAMVACTMWSNACSNTLIMRASNATRIAACET